MTLDDIPVTPPPRLWRIGETLLLSLALPALGLLIRPNDPLLLDAGLPWLLLAAPLLVGMRYGFAFGFGSSLLCVLLIAVDSWWRLGHLWPGISGTFPHASGLLLVGMLCGEMADTWRRRVERLAQLQQAQALRLETFVRHYNILRVSHDQLAERLAATPYTLRDSLARLAAECRDLARQDDPLEHAGQRLLNVFALTARVHQAALIRLDRHERPLPQPPLWLGGKFALDLEHPMLQACLQQHCLISLRDDQALLDEASSDSPLAVVPVIDAHERLYALVVVAEMAFIDFHSRQLQLLAVLGAELGALLSDAERAHQTSDEQSAQQRLAHWVALARRLRLASSLIELRVPSQIPSDAVERLQAALINRRRALDQVWSTHDPNGTRHLWCLLPLSDEVVARPCVSRLTATLENALGAPLGSTGIVLYLHAVDGRCSAHDLLSIATTQVMHDVNA